jgi:hypothetical protein
MTKEEIFTTLEGVPTAKEGRTQINEAKKDLMFQELSREFDVPVECFDIRTLSELNATTRSAYETTGRRLVASKACALPEWIFLGRVGVDAENLHNIANSMFSQLDGACSIAILFARVENWSPYRIFYAKGKITLAKKFANYFGVAEANMRQIGDMVPMGRPSPLAPPDIAGEKNTIFFGPPGTGKSTKVESRVQAAMMERTQFHPEYGHSDFIGSYRPVVGSESDSTNQVVGHDGTAITRPVTYFAFVPGPLTIVLKRAFGTREPVFLIIEEINRGDCSAIFGDVFQLLDRNYDGRSQFGITAKSELIAYFKENGVNFDIANDGKLYLPPNLSLLATMNTSDQSLYPMDAAFKRRWQWVACPIDFDQLLAYTDGIRPMLDDGKKKWDWIKLLELVNRNIVRDRMEDKQIGPWFIKPAKDGQISWESFLNKCLFYLWHDVFKDEQLSDLSPFNSDGPEVFVEVQSNIRENGLAAGFKPEFHISIAETIEAVPIKSQHSLATPQASS